MANTVLEAVGNYVDTNSADLTLGTNLFLSKMPESPDFCVALFEYEGLPPIETFGPSGFAVERPSLQVMVRAAREDYVTARDKAVTLRNLVSAISNTTLSNVGILRVASMGSVMPLGTDELERPIIVFNFDCFVGA